ncbi:hypothetical protein KBD45_04750 [Candidatus Dojkabacteria bacterium]|nr:hypothetical protein [Candidatus Dojkabacteria bacterium]
MKYSEFIKLIEKFLLDGKYPKLSVWPDKIELSGEFSKLNKQVFENTSTTGNEHEISIFYIDGDILASSILKGEKNQVKVKHDVNLAYVPQRTGVFEKQIYIDGKIVKKYSVKQVPPKQIVKYMINIHSHPKFKDLKGNENYSFFSVVDMEGFIKSNLLLTGLITDKFWLACKTDRTVTKVGTVGEEMIYFITEGAYEGQKDVEELVLKEMKNWGIVFYSGEIGGTLSRVN